VDNHSAPSVARVSALATQNESVSSSDAGITLAEIRDLTLWQLAVWPDSVARVSESVACQLALQTAPGFGQSVSHNGVSMLRIEPLKFWITGAVLSDQQASDGAVLDLSHSRTHVRLTGDKATTVLNSYLPLDLRDQSFPTGSVASTAFHHVGVTLWRSENGYELFIPRGFAVSLWEMLLDASEQYGLSVL